MKLHKTEHEISKQHSQMLEKQQILIEHLYKRLPPGKETKDLSNPQQ
jgi:hypothetical protein